MTEPTTPALRQEECVSDYVLQEGHRSVWITVGDVSVWIRRVENGAKVMIFDDELKDPLAQCEAILPTPNREETDEGPPGTGPTYPLVW